MTGPTRRFFPSGPISILLACDVEARRSTGAGADAGDPADVALDVEGELQATRPGEVDAVAGPQRPDLSFDVGSGGDVVAVGVGEAVPDVDEMAAGGLDPRLVEPVQIGHVARRRSVPHRRRAHPEEWPAIDLEGVDDALDPAVIGRFPLVRSDRQPDIGDAHLLPVVDAEGDDDDVRLFVVEDAEKGLVPVVVIVAHEARSASLARSTTTSFGSSANVWSRPQATPSATKSPITRILRAAGSFATTSTAASGGSFEDVGRRDDALPRPRNLPHCRRRRRPHGSAEQSLEETGFHLLRRDAEVDRRRHEHQRQGDG